MEKTYVGWCAHPDPDGLYARPALDLPCAVFLSCPLPLPTRFGNGVASSSPVCEGLGVRRAPRGL